MTVLIPSSTALLQGEIVCADMSQLVTNAASPTAEQAVLQTSALAGNPIGVYQGSTTTPSTTTQTFLTTLVRKVGYGVVNAGGVTTSVTVGGVLSVLPGSTPTYAQQVAPAFGATAGATTYYVGVTVATGAATTSGAVVITASTTTQGLVNAYIQVLG